MDILLALGLLKAYTKLTAGRCTSHKCLKGKTAIVTNSKNGIGYEVVQNLAMRGCKVIIADSTDIMPIQRNIAKRRNCGGMLYRNLDLSSLNSVREFAKLIKSTENRLDILINNANFGGTMDYTADGILKVVQMNALGNFLLTHLLMDLIKQTPGSRIVFITSVMAFLNRVSNVANINAPLYVKNVMTQNYITFANSKLCAAALSKGFAERLQGSGVICNAAYPGIVYFPKFAVHDMEWTYEHVSNKSIEGLITFLIKVYGKTMYEGSQTILHCALAKELENQTGRYFIDCKEFRGPRVAELQEFRTKLWEFSEQLVKLTDEEKLKPPAKS